MQCVSKLAVSLSQEGPSWRRHAQRAENRLAQDLVAQPVGVTVGGVGAPVLDRFADLVQADAAVGIGLLQPAQAAAETQHVRAFQAAMGGEVDE